MSKSTWTKIHLLKKKNSISDFHIQYFVLLDWIFFRYKQVKKMKDKTCSLSRYKVLIFLCSVAPWVNLFSVFFRNLWYQSINFFKMIDRKKNKERYEVYDFFFFFFGWSDDLTGCSFFQNMPYNQGLGKCALRLNFTRILREFTYSSSARFIPGTIAKGPGSCGASASITQSFYAL